MEEVGAELALGFQAQGGVRCRAVGDVKHGGKVRVVLDDLRLRAARLRNLAGNAALDCYDKSKLHSSQLSETAHAPVHEGNQDRSQR
jgi:hypothetical protein